MTPRMPLGRIGHALALAVLLPTCANGQPPLPHADEVDLQRFMGRWYVIATIPTAVETDSYDSTETYVMRADGKVATTYRYRNGSFDAPIKTMHPVGTVRPDTGNAVWGMQFVWPFKAEYVIAWVAPDYSQTIIARSKRDYAWYMARASTVSAADYTSAIERLRALGYDTSKVRRTPQHSPR